MPHKLSPMPIKPTHAHAHETHPCPPGQLPPLTPPLPFLVSPHTPLLPHMSAPTSLLRHSHTLLPRPLHTPLPLTPLPLPL
ncbi:unnamed protein product [Closterium sp. NIES-54]